MLERAAGGVEEAEPPLAHRSGGIALLFEEFGHRHIIGTDRELPLLPFLELHVVAAGGVTRVLAGHQRTARGAQTAQPA